MMDYGYNDKDEPVRQDNGDDGSTVSSQSMKGAKIEPESKWWNDGESAAGLAATIVLIGIAIAVAILIVAGSVLLAIWMLS